MRAGYVLTGFAAALVLAVGLIVVPFGADEVIAEPPATDEAETTAAPTKILLLDGVDLDAGPVILALHPLATGGEMKAVNDAAALRAAQNLPVYYTDDHDAESKLLLMSIAFLSPPGMSPREPFATVIQNGKVLRQMTCFNLHCREGAGGGLPHERDLGPLLDLARPVAEAHAFFDEPAAARARLAEIAADPDRFLLSEPDIPREGEDVAEGSALLFLPLQIWRAANPDEAWDDAAGAEALMPLLTAAVEASGADVSLGTLRFDGVAGPMALIEVETGRTAGSLQDPPLFDGFAYVTPYIHVLGSEAEIGKLRSSGALNAIEFPPDDGAALDAAFATFVRDAFGTDCTDCYELNVPITAVSEPEFASYEPASYYIGWYEIGDGTRP